MAATPYLYAHENRHAPRRANGKRFWGYPNRSSKIRVLAIHTTESALDTIGGDSGAEAVARYQSTTDRPSSYHRIVDGDSTIVCLPDSATAFGIGNFNSPTLHLALAMRAAEWDDPGKRAALERVYQRAVREAADMCKRHGIAVQRISRESALRGTSGIVAHATMDPGRRSDPGRNFPWTRFLNDVRALVSGQPPKPTPTPTPAPQPQEEDDMARLVTMDGVKMYAADVTGIVHVRDQAELALLRRAGIISSGLPPLTISSEDFDALVARSLHNRV